MHDTFFCKKSSHSVITFLIIIIVAKPDNYGAEGQITIGMFSPINN